MCWFLAERPLDELLLGRRGPRAEQLGATLASSLPRTPCCTSALLRHLNVLHCVQQGRLIARVCLNPNIHL